MNLHALFYALLYAVAASTPIHGFLYIDLFGGNDSIIFARIRCLIALRFSGFDIGDFENYPKNFRDDSVMELAQAGEYQGASDIEEYVKFAYAGTSPYIGCCNDYIKREVKFIGYENGQCEFVNLLTRNFEMIPETTNVDVSSGTIQFVSGLKIYFDFENRYIKRLNVFYTDDFLRIFFDVFLNSANTRKHVCGVMGGPCSTILNSTGSNVTCEDQLATFPSTDGQYYFDGKSQGCRALHAVFAEANPIDHCAHLSFTPIEDPSGNIKCQTSKNTLPSSLFTERELQLYEEFAESVGIDPKIGHNYVG